MNEFQEEMRELAAGLSEDGRELTRHVLGLELKNRFGERSQLPASFAEKALKTVKAASPEGSAS